MVAIRTGRDQVRPPFLERVAKASSGAVTGSTASSPKTSSSVPSDSRMRRDSSTSRPAGGVWITTGAENVLAPSVVLEKRASPPVISLPLKVNLDQVR